ncbi:MAG TPA: VOC family protein [Nitrospiraceae bacterium]|jgi:extradiol dioxygenase family protein|nr:VOC family protein [Nitrospiraceae bacterium]
MQALFHLAFPVHDLAVAKRFYVEGLDCVLGRESPRAITLGLAGHQLVAHVAKDPADPQKGIYPRHFGLILTVESDWEALVERAKAHGLKFYQQPRRRFAGTRIEHRTFFLEDPSGNLLEFKYYVHESAILGERDFSEVGDMAEH